MSDSSVAKKKKKKEKKKPCQRSEEGSHAGGVGQKVNRNSNKHRNICLFETEQPTVGGDHGSGVLSK